MMQGEEIERFKARSDAGRVATVVIVQNYKEGPDGRIPSTREAFLEDATPIEAVDDDTFRVAETGEVFRRAEPT